MKKNQFTNFDYEIITSSSTGKKEVKVSYQFNNKQCRKYLLVDESKKLNDSEYIEIAKEQIEESIKNGQLAKYSKQFTFSVHFGVIPTVIASIAGVAAITCASLFAWKAVTGGGGGGDDPGPVPPTPSGETEIVDFLNEDGTLFKREKVTKGDKVTKPETDPIADDGCFANWYTEPTFENVYDFDTDVEGDLKLYPKFSKLLLLMDYHYQGAVEGGLSTPEVEIAIDANENEEIFVDWDEGKNPEQITNFNEHITHKYASGLGDEYLEIAIYGNANAVSLASVDETETWKTHLFKDDNAYINSVFLVNDMKDTSKSSCMGGLMQNESDHSKLKTIGIFSGVTHVPNHFAACASVIDNCLIDRDMFANSVTDIGQYAFANNPTLTRIMLKDTIKHIGEGAFYNCSNANYIRFGRHLESIGNEAFGNIGNTSMLVEALYYEWTISGKETLPLFGTQTGLTITAFYTNPEGGEEFSKALHDKKWPVPPNPIEVARLTYTTSPASLHQFIITNIRFPLLYNSPISEENWGFKADVECVDSPEFIVTSDTVYCGTRDISGSGVQWLTSMFGNRNIIAIATNDLSDLREWPSVTFEMFSK